MDTAGRVMCGGEDNDGICEVAWAGIKWFLLPVGCVQCWKSDCGGKIDCSAWCNDEVVSGDVILEWMLQGL